MTNYTLKRITQQDFKQFYSLLEQDFCFLERKDYQEELASFGNSNFVPAFIFSDNKCVGYVCYWEFEEFLFVEHFAILKEMRNQGVGTGFFREFLNDISKLVLLEVERPNDIISKRRICFYEEIGFYVNQYDYQQPSYHPDTEGIPMFICSYDRSISAEEYSKYTYQIETVVYP